MKQTLMTPKTLRRQSGRSTEHQNQTLNSRILRSSNQIPMSIPAFLCAYTNKFEGVTSNLFSRSLRIFFITHGRDIFHDVT